MPSWRRFWTNREAYVAVAARRPDRQACPERSRRGSAALRCEIAFSAPYQCRTGNGAGRARRRAWTNQPRARRGVMCGNQDAAAEAGRRKEHEGRGSDAQIGTVVVAASAATNPRIPKPRAERGAALSGAPPRAVPRLCRTVTFCPCSQGHLSLHRGGRQPDSQAWPPLNQHLSVHHPHLRLQREGH